MWPGDEIRASRRRPLDHEEIESIARKCGFGIVMPQTSRVAEQARLFSEAAVIAGAHGAGFANLVFVSAAIRLVELIGPQNSGSPWSMPFAGIAALSGQDFTSVSRALTHKARSSATAFPVRLISSSQRSSDA